jgi:hypothetical protein
MPKPPPGLRDVFNVNLPDDFLRAIGHVCAQFGSLEFLLGLMIQKVGCLPTNEPSGLIITNHMPFRLKLDIAKTLATSKEDEFPQLKKFRELAVRIQNLEGRRNKIVHGNWGHDQGTPLLIRATARGELKMQHERVRTEDVEKLAEDIGRANVDIMKVFVWYE